MCEHAECKEQNDRLLAEIGSSVEDGQRLMDEAGKFFRDNGPPPGFDFRDPVFMVKVLRVVRELPHDARLLLTDLIGRYLVVGKEAEQGGPGRMIAELLGGAKPKDPFEELMAKLRPQKPDTWN